MRGLDIMKVSWIMLSWFVANLVSSSALFAGPFEFKDLIFNNNEITLATTWGFVPHAWLSENDIRSHEKLGARAIPFDVPGGVREALVAVRQDTSLNDWGTAFIILKNVTAQSRELGLRLRADTAYHIYWTNLSADQPWQRVMEAGTPGRSAAESVPFLADGLARLPYSGPGDYALVIHLSGFHYSDANIWKAPVIGDYNRLESSYFLQLVTTLLVVGMILIMAIYYLSLFFHHREDRSSLWLTIFTFVVFLRYIGTSAEFTGLPFVTPSITLYEILRKFEFGLLGIGAVFGLLYTAETFSYERFRKFALLNLIPAGMWTLFCLMTRAPTYQTFLPMVACYVLAIAALCFGLVIHAAVHRVTGSYLLVTGFLMFMATLVNDLFIGLAFLRTSVFLIPFGFTALVFMQGQVIAGLFAVAFRTAQRLTLHLKAEVDRQTREIRSMLDHIPQGVLSFVGNGIADANYSVHLEKILGTPDITGRSLSELILDRSSLNADERDRAHQTLLASLGEHVMGFELNSHLLPHEVELKVADKRTKILELTWSAVPDDQDKVDKVLVTLHDVTKMREFQEESKAQRRQIEYIQEIVAVSAAGFSQFMASAMQFMQDNHRLICSNAEKNLEVVKILFVNMHTIKGAARTLGFHLMTGTIHEVEQAFADLMRNPEAKWERQALLDGQKRVMDFLEEYQRINNEVLGRGAISAENVVVERSLLEDQVMMLNQLLPHHAADPDQERYMAQYEKLEEVAFSDAADLFLDILQGANKVARDLGKPDPTVVVKGAKVRVNYRLQSLLRNVFTHIIRNSIDHGIEPPEERLRKGKKEHGSLEVLLSEVDGGLLIKYHDNGRGLNLKTLWQKGVDLGLFDATATPPRHEIANLIFVAGLSTAQGVTQFSGRGVGMDAVRRYIQEAGGDIYLHLEEEAEGDFVPFTICIIIPHIYYISLGEVI
jgi:HPt (histidine-containing phosphotransfer) domain-containing protein